MDTKDIAAVLLRVTGLAIVAHALFQLPEFFSPQNMDSAKFSVAEAAVSAVFYLGLPVIVGLLFWFFPATITNKIVEGEKLSSSFGSPELERVALTVIGVWIAAYGTAELIANVAWIYRTQNDYPVVPSRVFAATAGSVARVVVGVGIAIGAKGISQFVRRLRGHSDG